MTDWVEAAVSYGVTLTEAQIAQFNQYEALLLAWNQHMNLTAVREPEQIRVRHFLDALSCVRVTGDLNGRSLIDVGTGAGFPGLALKIAFPQLRLTLVESVQKKVRFLEAVVSELGLPDVTCLAERAEAVGQMPAHRACYDWVVARAVAELRVLVEYLLPLCRMGGHVLAQKGESAAEETAAAEAAIRTLGGGVPALYAVQLPEREQVHYLAVIEKVANTPAAYPRRVGLPAKRPL